MDFWSYLKRILNPPLILFYTSWTKENNIVVAPWNEMSGSIDPWRSVTNSQHPDPDRAECVMCDAVLMTQPRPLAIPGQPVWAPACIFIWDSDTGRLGRRGRDVRLGSGSRVARDVSDAGGPSQATARPRPGPADGRCNASSVEREVRRVRHWDMRVVTV